MQGSLVCGESSCVLLGTLVQGGGLFDLVVQLIPQILLVGMFLAILDHTHSWTMSPGHAWRI